MAVLVLSGLLLVGMGFRYMHRTMRVIPADAYADADSLLRQGSVQQQAAHASGTDRSHTDSRVLLPQSPVPSTIRIDLNTATAGDLERLPRIGPKLAARIIAYREANGPFKRVQDLTRVSGIGDKTLSRLEGLIYVGNER